MLLPSVIASPPPILSFDAVPPAVPECPAYGNGAGTPGGVGGAIGGIFDMAGGVRTVWLLAVVATCRKLSITVGIAYSLRAILPARIEPSVRR